MKNSTARMMMYAAFFGVVLGVILIIWLTFDYIMGYYGQNKLMSNFNYLARILGVFICILIYRNKFNRGYISLGKAFSFGLLSFMTAMLLLEIFVCLLVNFVDSNYLAVKAGLMTEQLSSIGMHSGRIGDIISLAIYIDHPIWAIVIALLGGLVVGTCVSFISALILKKEDNSKKSYNKRKLKIRN